MSIYNHVQLMGHLLLDPQFEKLSRSPWRQMFFMFNIPRVPNPERKDAFLFDVARIRVDDTNIIEKAKNLRTGVMISLVGHIDYVPLQKVPFTIVMDDFEYMGGVLFVPTKKELLEVMAGGKVISKYNERSYVSKTVEILRVKDKV